MAAPRERLEQKVEKIIVIIVFVLVSKLNLPQKCLPRLTLWFETLSFEFIRNQKLFNELSLSRELENTFFSEATTIVLFSNPRKTFVLRPGIIGE